MQDRANVSADFLEMMKQEIIDVIKKYIEVEESEIDVRLTNEVKEDGTTGAPSLYANIPILNVMLLWNFPRTDRNINEPIVVEISVIFWSTISLIGPATVFMNLSFANFAKDDLISIYSS